MKKILVTGAAGYVGEGVVRELKKHSDLEVFETDFCFNKISDPIHQKQCNLFEVKNPFEYFNKPDIVLHLAWKDGFNHNSESHLSNLSKHVEFISNLAQSGIKEICVMGSMHEVGFYEGRIKEDTPCNPESRYGIAKNALRQATKVLCKQNDVCFKWLRGYYIVGNVEKGNSIFSKITQAVRAGKTSFPFTTGVNQYDFLNYDEFCKQVVAATIQNKINGIIDCCSGKPQQLGKRIEQFIKDNDYNINLEYGVFPERSYDSLAVWGDSTKINQIIMDNNNG